VERLSAEHGQLSVAPKAAPLAVGDRLEVVPGYADLTVFLHDRFYGFRSGQLAEILPIAGSDASR
jgi:D-serine deaminase-like pyridoxal phosphate-dependent protein